MIINGTGIPESDRSRQKTALEKIEEFLEKEDEWSNAELIRQMREAYFADVDEFVKSGELILPD
jgi:hypothetical protein